LARKERGKDEEEGRRTKAPYMPEIPQMRARTMVIQPNHKPQNTIAMISEPIYMMYACKRIIIISH